MIQNTKRSTGTVWSYELSMIDVLDVQAGHGGVAMAVQPKGGVDYVVLVRGEERPRLITTDRAYACAVARAHAKPNAAVRAVA